MSIRYTGQAFTLIELLVVIGILSVLVGILLPALNRSRQQARLAVCASNLRQWGLGLQMYVDENRGALPLRVPDGTATEYFGPSPVNPIPGYPTGLDDLSIFFNALPYKATGKSYYQLLLDDKTGRGTLPAVGSNSIFTCPSSQAAVAIPGSGDSLFPGNPNFYALFGTDSSGQLLSSTTPLQFKSDLSYCYNKNLMNPPSAWAGNPSPALVTGARMSQLRPASAVVVVAEKISYPAEYRDPLVQRWAAKNPTLATSGKINPAVGYTGQISTLKVNWKNFAARHQGGGNLLFADGHVALYRWPDVQVQPTSSFGIPNANRADLIWCPWGPTNN